MIGRIISRSATTSIQGSLTCPDGEGERGAPRGSQGPCSGACTPRQGPPVNTLSHSIVGPDGFGEVLGFDASVGPSFDLLGGDPVPGVEVIPLLARVRELLP
jgi:hypothetical protein